jgi:hypothetical protein
MTLTEIKRRVKPGQVYSITNHRQPDLEPVTARIKWNAASALWVEHALGDSRIGWPPARHVTRDEDGTLHLRGTGVDAGLPFLTLVPADRTEAS